jgi:hypothetical protein
MMKFMARAKSAAHKTTTPKMAAIIFRLRLRISIARVNDYPCGDTIRERAAAACPASVSGFRLPVRIVLLPILRLPPQYYENET